jgi:hypothetical protein
MAHGQFLLKGMQLKLINKLFNNYFASRQTPAEPSLLLQADPTELPKLQTMNPILSTMRIMSFIESNIMSSISSKNTLADKNLAN